MSRSRKKHPFMAIAGSGAKQDKRWANRGVRRKFHSLLRQAISLEKGLDLFEPPHRYECSWNNTYLWNRDGRQQYEGLGAKDWYTYLEALKEPRPFSQWTARYAIFPPAWWTEMMRK